MPDVFDIGSRPVSGSYFLRSRKPGAFSAAALEPYVDPYANERLVWTRREERSTLKEALLEMIRGARRKIFIASFRIGDKELFDELFEAVDRLRGSVYVITLVDEKSLAKGLAELDDAAGADKQALEKQFAPLVSRGIYLRGHDSCHAKFVVVDDEIALVSSANLESRAFTTTTEIGVVLRAKAEVERMARLFTRLWHECTWEVAPGPFYSVATRAPTPPPFQTMPGPMRWQYGLWTHHTEHQILKAARETIRSALGELLLASFSLRGMSTHRDLLLADVDQFRKRTGGRVRLLVRSQNHIPSQRQDAEEFAKLGVEVFADDVNHAKCVIADRQQAILFSANFDAQHGLTSGVEAGMRLLESWLVRRASEFFEGLLRAAPIELRTSPTHEALQTLAAGWIKPWKLDKTIRVVASDEDWNVFASLEAGRPVLFEAGTDNRLVLIAGRQTFLLQEGGATRPWQLKRSGNSGVDSTATFEEWLGKTGGIPEIRGVCTGVFVRD